MSMKAAGRWLLAVGRGDDGRWHVLLGLLAVAGILAAVAATACGGDSDQEPEPTRTATPGTPTPAVSATPSPTSVPLAELRVAFVNLQSPLTIDAEDPVAGDTFTDRLALITAELQSLNVDIVGFSEASDTDAHGSAITHLARELKMEVVYFRANPWRPGGSREQSDALVELQGFEEGGLLLVRSDRWPLAGDPQHVVLNPLTSELGERRIAIHLRVKAPAPVGEIDFYLTHLTGGGDAIRLAQAQDLAEWITQTRGTGPAILMGDFSEVPGSPAMTIFDEMAFVDFLAERPTGTCCRETVVGEQPPLEMRTDYILASRWLPTSVTVFANRPGQRADGTLLYASDHNGLIAIFDLEKYVTGLPR